MLITAKVNILLTACKPPHHDTSGADPEILHGRWLMGWALATHSYNYTGEREVASYSIHPARSALLHVHVLTWSGGNTKRSCAMVL